ncbi:MAG: alpha/beta fold hydrolase [Betaproteobacteria bacterium]
MNFRLWLRRLFRLGMVLLCGYVALALFVMFGQRSLYYHPPHVSAAELTDYARERQMQPWTNSAGFRIGWQRASRLGSALGAVLITHGNGGTAVGREYLADPLQAALPLDVYILEYPGYADRSGSPSQASLLAAGEEAIALLSGRAPLYLVTESLGTGVGAWLAGKYSERVSGLCCLVPYNNLTEVVRRQMPWLPVSLLLWDRYPAAEWLRNYHGPLAVCVGGNDRTIAPELGRALHEGYDGPKKLWVLPGQDHEQATHRPPAWWREVGALWRVFGRN